MTDTRTVPVLLVDDDALILEEMSSSLERSGLGCRSALSGREALTILRGDSDTRVLVTDLRMPGMDGFALIQAVRDELPVGLQPQIVFISAHLDGDAARRAMRSNAVDFLNKPFSRKELIDSVERALDKSNAERARYETVETVEASVSSMRAQVEELSAKLSVFHHAASSTSSQDRTGAATDSPAVQRQMEALEEVVRLRDRRTIYFPPSLFSDPSWDMLLDLASAHLNGQRTYVSSLSVGAQVPLTTTLRYLDTLASQDLVRRFRDPQDKRRMIVELTDVGIDLMGKYLEGVIDRER